MRNVSAITIEKGTKFHAVIADGNPEWEVTGKAGRGVWRAKCLGPDYSGEVRPFTEAQIRQSVGMAMAFERIDDENAAFYASLKLGALVHYNNGFEDWYRCEVVMGTTSRNATPHKCLKVIALVGAWREFDLPRRRPDGSIDLGLHAKMIGECFEPNSGSIYEAREHVRRTTKDPSNLPEIDLSVPEMDANAVVKAALWKAVQKAQAALASEDDSNRSPRARLEEALKIIQGAL